jgi:hypothetical protein
VSIHIWLLVILGPFLAVALPALPAVVQLPELLFGRRPQQTARARYVGPAQRTAVAW